MENRCWYLLLVAVFCVLNNRSHAILLVELIRYDL